MAFPRQDPRSVLLVTLDSCRYDTFERALAPHLRRVGPLHRAYSPATFTLPAHAAIFRGFTPGDPQSTEPLVNPKFGKFFRMVYGSFPPDEVRRDVFELAGADVADGFGRLGYTTIGAGAMTWFDESLPTGLTLTEHFDRFFYSGVAWGLPTQLPWLEEQLGGVDGPTFCFLNVGETHLPYWHVGAPWEWHPSPCEFYDVAGNDAEECARRQLGCLEYVDSALAPLLEAYAEATVIVCADHGDAWGEDGMWAHGFHHPKVLEVPLLFRVAGLEPADRVDQDDQLPVGQPSARIGRVER